MNYKMTAEQVIALGPCGVDDEDDGTNYTPERIRRLFEAAGLVEASAIDILCRGPELGISAQDLLWLVIRPEFIEPLMRAKFSLLCAEHVEASSEAAQRCNAVTRRFLGGAATTEEFEAALMATSAARATARDAAMAAEVAVRGDAWAAEAADAAIRTAQAAARAAWAAEAEWQCETLLSLLRGTSDE